MGEPEAKDFVGDDWLVLLVLLLMGAFFSWVLNNKCPKPGSP
jgi:hypothetical protein